MSNRRQRRRQRMATVSAMKPEAKAPKRQGGAEGEERGLFGQISDGARGVVNRIDDSTQAFVRDNILQLPTDGSRLPQDATLSGVRQALGKSVFKARSGYEGDNTAYRGTGTTNDNIGLALSRALQGGTITAAGYGLAQLTTQFGSQADYQEPNQLSL